MINNKVSPSTRSVPFRLRITAGEYKNTPLKVPESARPVMERVKLALFSVIDEYVKNACCLDLFAGAGNLGLEALSRGASSCDFVDTDYFSIKYIRENIEKIEISFKTTLKAETFREESQKYIANTDRDYDLVFIDPPYDQTNHKHLFKLVHEIVRLGGIIIYLSNHTNHLYEKIGEINPNLEVIDSRKYGITHIDIIRVKTSKDEVSL